MSSLKQRSAYAFVWEVIGSVLRQGSGFIISIFLARLLKPEEFGLVGIAMVFISISQVFIDVGFGSALIQKKENSDLTYSSVFYLNFLAGLLLTAIFYVAAPWIGVFYNSQEITRLIRWLSLIFLFNSLCIVQQAILTRELNFRALSLRTVIASLIGGLLGIIFALRGFGVYSLVVQQLCTAFLSTLLLWRVSSWKPSLAFSLKELKNLTAFSFFVFLDEITSAFFAKLDTLFIGKVFTPSVLGYYSRAESLNRQVTTYTSASLRKVFYPVLSSLQNDEERFNRIYFRLVSFVSFVSFLISGILYIMAEPFIIGLFGNQWMFSVMLFQILVFKSFNVPLNSMMLNALLSKGRSKEIFVIGLFRKIIRALPILIGLKYGLIPFVWSITIVSYLLTVYNAFFIKRYLKLKLLYHLRKIFEGIVPLIVIVITANYFPEGLSIKFTLVGLFILLYLAYASLIKMEGFIFAKNELIKVMKNKNVN